MVELRSAAPGIVRDLLVDEGTMVAEEDPIVEFEGPLGREVLAVIVPGVLREWHVRPGDSVAAGELLALIDET
ncbi:MAG: biotin/lipoyl-binding protein [Acidimicrobiia bacterium]